MLKICMPAATNIPPVIEAASTVGSRTLKRNSSLLSDCFKNLYTGFTNDEICAKIFSAFPCFTPPVTVTLIQCTDDLNVKSCKIADFYDLSTVNDIFIEEFYSYINNSMGEHWATHASTKVTNIHFKE